jgi:hypothetical protein
MTSNPGVVGRELSGELAAEKQEPTELLLLLSVDLSLKLEQ